MSDTPLPPELDAYALLSRPTLDLSDAEVLAVVEDLRRRRTAYIKTGKVDTPKKERAAAVKLSADEKARNTAALMEQLKIPGLGKLQLP